MSSRVVALIGAALLVAGIWIDHLYNELDLQKAHYETRIAVLAEEVSQKDKARAEAVAAAERAARQKLEKSVKLLMHVCKRWLLPLAAIALACLSVGCACTTKPSALPVPVVAPEVKTPIPPELLKIPDRPEPLAPGYAATH